MTSLTKSQTQKVFSIANYKTCRAFLTFEQLSSAHSAWVRLAQSHLRTGYFRTNCLN